MRSAARGQASIEYLVVLVFSVMLLVTKFSYDDSNPPSEDTAMTQLSNAVKDYHKNYTFAIAIASIPDCEYQSSYDISTFPQAITTAVGATQITVGTDICIDWGSPAIPNVDVNGIPLGDFTKNIGDMIASTVSNTVHGFLSPSIDSLLNFINPF